MCSSRSVLHAPLGNTGRERAAFLAPLTLKTAAAPAWQPDLRLPWPPGQATDRDPRRRPIENYWRAATTLSNRDSSVRDASCAFSAFSAEKRLHDPVHENDK